MPTKQERQTITRLIDEFGADIMIERRDVLPNTPRDRIALRNSAEDAITDLYANHPELSAVAPLLPEWSPYNLDRIGRVAVIGPCPTWEDARRGEIGHSRASKLMRSQLQHFGLLPHMVTNLHCVPHWCSAGERDNRPPSPRELALCRELLFQCLDAADVDYVLLHGAHAMGAWRNDVTLKQVAGGLHLWKNRWFVFPTYHASAVLRQDGFEAKEWRKQLGKFVGHVQDQDGFEAFATRCARRVDGCSEPMYAYDEDGIAWCRGDFRDHHHKTSNINHRTKTNINQGELL